MKRILVTTDFSTASQTAFAAAKEQAVYAGKESSRIVLLSVLEDFLPGAMAFEVGAPVIDSKAILDEAYKQAAKKIKEIKHESFEGYHVDTEVVTATRPIYEEIAEYAAKEDVDLIVLATHGRTGASRLFLGSVAERVVREAKCAVLVVPAKE